MRIWHTLKAGLYGLDRFKPGGIPLLAADKANARNGRKDGRLKRMRLTTWALALRILKYTPALPSASFIDVSTLLPALEEVPPPDAGNAGHVLGLRQRSGA
ncbi:hypothetical protein APHAL10511_008697 [Amanita phalloides]|nr:hypothetical protein APHAL10511_008697 [Amanita phalloides]